MKAKHAHYDFLKGGQSEEAYSSLALKEFLEYTASVRDNELKNQFLKEMILKYSAAERKLVELNQLKNKFLGIAAHDLRNPITSIKGFSELLLGEDIGALTEEQKEFITIIHDACHDMLILLNDLLDISVIESGKLELRFKSGQLKQSIEERIRLNEIIAQKKGIMIHTKLSEMPEAIFDSERIGQAVDNLISNAIKFSSSGSKIHVILDRKGNMAKVSIQDEGPGISSEDQLKLFGEFQKLGNQPTGGEKSTGLGLAIVKKIIEAHGGSVGVESQIGKGSTFSFTIPLGGENDRTEKT